MAPHVPSHATPSDRADVALWCARDHARALHPADHAAIDSTASPRALVLDLAGARAPHHDLFSACAVLGRLVAERGGSPTLVSATIDGAREALGHPLDAQWLVPARAALLEGFAAARRDAARADAAAAWEYPRCAVRLDDATVAIAPGYPVDDGEALTDWASRVAHGASLAGVRRAVVGGDGSSDRRAVRDALESALRLVGIEVLASLPTRAAWMPWRRRRNAR